MPNSSQKLSAYAAKRNAATTNEPFEAEPTYSGETATGVFVVHLHDARRRHYDLRLEVGGVLKSFAVPRGPSLSPEDRRLAVETEDHPIAYLDFEAVIPPGNYGAGPMIVWDAGRVRYLDGSAEAGLARGKLDFELVGYKLAGGFTLVRAQKHEGGAQRADLGVHGGEREGDSLAREWLLIKKQDAHARAGIAVVDASPRSVVSGLSVDELRDALLESERLEQRAEALGAPLGEVDAARQTPMLCTSAPAVSDRPDFIYELKLDGFRIVAEKRAHDVALYYRRRGPATAAFPEIVRALRGLPARRVVLDGELVCFDERGRPSFQRLLARTGIRSHDREVRPGRRAGSGENAAAARYVAFDLLALGPYDLRPLPLARRKELLGEVLRGVGALRTLDHVVGSSRALLAFCEKEDLEGIVAKRAASSYVAGPRRSGDWIKVKRLHDQELVVVGMTRGSGSRADLGALDVAAYSGKDLVLRGRVGSGLDDRTIAELLERLGPLVSARPTAQGEPEPAPQGRVWVLPRVVVNVRFSGLTDEGRLRHPVFRGIRDDVAVADCVMSLEERASPASEREPATRAMPTPSASAVSGAGLDAGRGARRVRVSNPKKTFWPGDALTKGDLCAYYERIAPTLLPHLRDRPVVLVRYPDGIAGKSFYQWNVPAGTPSWIPTLAIARDDDDQRRVHCFLINDADTLLYVANLGCIPIHVLAARSRSLERCDFITFDFDIGAQPFAHAVELCLTLRGLLAELGLTGYAKTSGQSGLHVLVPMGDGVTFPVARALVELLGRLLEQRHAAIATMERRVQERGSRVYIDTGQTGRSRTIVAPYSVRAHEGAPVSTPLRWDEVTATLQPRTLSIASVPERVRAVGDPMAGMLLERPDVALAVARLQTMLTGGKA